MRHQDFFTSRALLTFRQSAFSFGGRDSRKNYLGMSFGHDDFGNFVATGASLFLCAIFGTSRLLCRCPCAIGMHVSVGIGCRHSFFGCRRLIRHGSGRLGIGLRLWFIRGLVGYGCGCHGLGLRLRFLRHLVGNESGCHRIGLRCVLRIGFSGSQALASHGRLRLPPQHPRHEDHGSQNDQNDRHVAQRLQPRR